MKGSATRVGLLMIGLAFGSSAAQTSQGVTDIARQLDERASRVLEDSSASSRPFTPHASRFLESLDDFVGAARELASGGRGLHRSDPAVRRLSMLAGQVSAAIVLANVTPDIASQWESTRVLLDELRAPSHPAGAATAWRSEPQGDESAEPAADLARASQQLVAAARTLHPAGASQRVLLLNKTQRLAEACAAVERAARPAGLRDPQVGLAVEKAVFYSERVEQSIGEADGIDAVREAHEAFLTALDRVQAAMREPVAAERPEAKPIRKLKKPSKAKKVKKAGAPAAVKTQKAQ